MLGVEQEAEVGTCSLTVVRPFYYPGGTLNAVGAQIDNVPIAVANALVYEGRATVVPEG
jgi:hypothetical protein